MGLIKVGSHVDLDFDHQFIPTHKFDAKYSYKQDHGYFPGRASIGGIIAGGENRSDPIYEQSILRWDIPWMNSISLWFPYFLLVWVGDFMRR